jgi:hypothetical protein
MVCITSLSPEQIREEWKQQERAVDDSLAQRAGLIALGVLIVSGMPLLVTQYMPPSPTVQKFELRALATALGSSCVVALSRPIHNYLVKNRRTESSSTPVLDRPGHPCHRSAWDRHIVPVMPDGGDDRRAAEVSAETPATPEDDHLSALPPELRALIFGQLDPLSLSRVEQTSRGLVEGLSQTKCGNLWEAHLAKRSRHLHDRLRKSEGLFSQVNWKQQFRQLNSKAWPIELDIQSDSFKVSCRYFVFKNGDRIARVVASSENHGHSDRDQVRSKAGLSNQWEYDERNSWLLTYSYSKGGIPSWKKESLYLTPWQESTLGHGRVRRR